MATLTKREAQLHREACALVSLDRPLTEVEKEFVLDHWQESATATNALAGAFFTPRGLARDLAVQLGSYGTRILDLCAGTGRLAFECRREFGHRWHGEPRRELVCFEKDPAYVQVGRRVLPEATWVCGDIFDLPADLGTFDACLCNPPFGPLPRTGTDPGRYRGRRFEYHALTIAAQHARTGVFLLPQNSAPFRSSGQPTLTWAPDQDYQRFHAATGITVEPGCGWDTSVYAREWRGVSPRVEIVPYDLEHLLPTAPETAAGSDQLDLLAMQHAR